MGTAGSQRGGAPSAASKPRQSILPQQPPPSRPHASSTAPFHAHGLSSRIHSSPPEDVPLPSSSDQGGRSKNDAPPMRGPSGSVRREYDVGGQLATGLQTDYAQDDDEEVFDEEDQEGAQSSGGPASLRRNGDGSAAPLSQQGLGKAGASFGAHGRGLLADPRQSEQSWAAMLGLEEGDGDLDEGDEGYHPAFTARAKPSGRPEHEHEHGRASETATAHRPPSDAHPGAPSAAAAVAVGLQPSAASLQQAPPWDTRGHEQYVKQQQQYMEQQAPPMMPDRGSNPKHQPAVQTPSHSQTHTLPLRDRTHDLSSFGPSNPQHWHLPQTPLLQASSWGGSQSRKAFGDASGPGSDSGGTPPLSSVKALAQHLQHHNPHQDSGNCFAPGAQRERSGRIVQQQSSGAEQRVASSSHFGYDPSWTSSSGRDSQPSYLAAVPADHRSRDGQGPVGVGRAGSRRESYEAAPVAAAVAPGGRTGGGGGDQELHRQPHHPGGPVVQQRTAAAAAAAALLQQAGDGRGLAGPSRARTLDSLIREVKHADGKHERFYSRSVLSSCRFYPVGR